MLNIKTHNIDLIKKISTSPPICYSALLDFGSSSATRHRSKFCVSDPNLIKVLLIKALFIILGIFLEVQLIIFFLQIFSVFLLYYRSSSCTFLPVIQCLPLLHSDMLISLTANGQ